MEIDYEDVVESLLDAADELATAVIAEQHAQLTGRESDIQAAREKIYAAMNVYIDLRRPGK